MLPLVTNILPQSTASQANALAATQAAFQALQGISSTRQLTTAAINASPAASAYSSQLPERRATSVRSAATPQPERAEILPDPEFWKVPTRLAGDPVVTPPPRPPITVNLPQVSQFTAQALSQQAPREELEQQEPVTRRVTTLPGKQPSLSDARGADAYAVAASRAATIRVSAPTQALS